MVIMWFFLLVPFLIGRSIETRQSAIVTFIAFEAAYFSEIVALAYSPSLAAKCTLGRQWVLPIVRT